MRDFPLFDPSFMSAHQGYVDPDEFYEDIEPSDLDDLYHGRNVIWIGTGGDMVRVHKDYIDPIDGNIFYPEKFTSLVEKIKYSESKGIAVMRTTISPRITDIISAPMRADTLMKTYSSKFVG